VGPTAEVSASDMLTSTLLLNIESLLLFSLIFRRFFSVLVQETRNLIRDQIEAENLLIGRDSLVN
jgi:hypothetical protein